MAAQTGRISSWKVLLNTGMGCPGSQWSHHSWRCSRNDWTWCLVLWFSWHGGVWSKVGLHGLRGLFQPERLCKGNSMAIRSQHPSTFTMQRANTTARKGKSLILIFSWQTCDEINASSLHPDFTHTITGTSTTRNLQGVSFAEKALLFDKSNTTFPIISRYHLSYQCQVLISGKRQQGWLLIQNTSPLSPRHWYSAGISPLLPPPRCVPSCTAAQVSPWAWQCCLLPPHAPSTSQDWIQISGGSSRVPQGFPHAGAALTAQVWAWFGFATQKLRAVGKQDCLLIGACTWWKWACTKAERKGTFGVQLCFELL